MKPIKKINLALGVFFTTEMWERYGFYVAQSLLALFLILHLHVSDKHSYLLVGSFTALTYISPVMGGWIADHCLGQKKAVLTGAVFLFFSYIVLAFATTLYQLTYALAMIAMGTGLLKPNISALLGKLYRKTDPRRNSAFTIFYLGITLGIVLGTTLPSQLQASLGWRVCFLSATLGFTFAFCIFYFGVKRLKIKDYRVPKRSIWLNSAIASAIILVAYGAFLLVLNNPTVADTFCIIVALASAGVVIRIAFQQQGDQRRKTLLLLLLFIISTGFWSFYFQIFTELTVFITRAVQQTIFGVHFPAPYYVAIESIGMLVIGVLLIKLWAKLRHKNIAYASAVKFFLAMLCLLGAYGIILWASSHHTSNALISAWPILGAFVVISLAELLLSPIGLSTVTQLSEEKVVSTLMGVFLVSLGLGGFIAGQLAELAAIDSTGLSLVALKTQYFHSFQHLTLILLGVVVVSAVICLIIRQLSRRITWQALERHKP